MTKLNLKYKGNLQVESTHLNSGEKIFTDAPVDNNGLGRCFSPTDLLANAYASCMLTVIGIYCQQNNLDFTRGEVSVEKIMVSNPRRVGKLIVNFDLNGNNWTKENRQKIESVAIGCPVAKSINNDIETKITFEYE